MLLAGKEGSRVKGERFADLKLWAGDQEVVEFTVPADLDSIYMYSRTWEDRGMAYTIEVVH